MLSVPESPSAVLALVPDPAREAHTVARGRVALAVHTRFVAFLRLGDAGQSGEQAGRGQQQRRAQHQQAPSPAGTRAGPPRRPVHSLTKDGCLRQALRRFGDAEPGSCPQLSFRKADPRLGSSGRALTIGVFASARRCWVLGLHLSWGPVSQRRTEPHIDIQK